MLVFVLKCVFFLIHSKCQRRANRTCGQAFQKIRFCILAEEERTNGIKRKWVLARTLHETERQRETNKLRHFNVELDDRAPSVDVTYVLDRIMGFLDIQRIGAVNERQVDCTLYSSSETQTRAHYHVINSKHTLTHKHETTTHSTTDEICEK